ncbi:ABC transporter permease [bacterium]|nr:MAG: ABC transporter permease [bacterium]
MRGILKFFAQITDFFALGMRVLGGLFIRPYYVSQTIDQMYLIGVQSLPIVALTSFFTGMILALQSGHEMAVFGAKMYVGTLVSLSLIRELGPVLTGVVVAGRVGAGIAAELGSMKVTEQIDALRAMGTDPVKKLVGTRFIAGLVVIPVLTILADGLGIFGGLFVSNSTFGISPQFYWKTVIDALDIDDILMGIAKPFVFALLLIWVACYKGLSAEGGTEGVGRATTQAVVISSILILVGDYFVTQVLIWILGM